MNKKSSVKSTVSVTHTRQPLFSSLCSPVSGLWSLVFGLWSLVSGLWSLVFGLWSLVSGLWSLVFVSGLWSLVFGLWSLVSGLWSLVFGLWSLVSGLWSLVFSLWFLVSGLWSLVFGLWSLGSGLWSLVSGLWSLVSGSSSLVNENVLKTHQQRRDWWFLQMKRCQSSHYILTTILINWVKYLKGPKHENFGSQFLTLSKPNRVGPGRKIPYECAPSEWGGDTLACVWGGGGAPIRTTWEKAYHSICSAGDIVDNPTPETTTSPQSGTKNLGRWLLFFYRRSFRRWSGWRWHRPGDGD
jgi:hypothetical protein